MTTDTINKPSGLNPHLKAMVDKAKATYTDAERQRFRLRDRHQTLAECEAYVADFYADRINLRTLKLLLLGLTNHDDSVPDDETDNIIHERFAWVIFDGAESEVAV